MTESVAEAVEVAPAQTPRTQKIGRVVSDKMEKTVVVAVDSVRRHPLYHKRITRTSKFLRPRRDRTLANRGISSGIEETRPLSKRKRSDVRELSSGVCRI